MKELFFYNKPDQQYGPPQVLIVKLAEKYWSYATTNQQGTELYAVCYCNMEEGDETVLKTIEEKYPGLGHSYYEVKVIFDFPRSLLLPFNETTGEDMLSLLNDLYGFQGTSVAITESIPTWQLKNIYAVPRDIYDWVRKKFPSAKYLHQYSASIMNLGAAGHEGTLLVDFRNNEFSVLAGKQHKFLFARTFEYETPEDVLFYLLKVCEQFALSPKEVSVELSGLIEKESSLYKELYQYFLDMDLRDASWNTVNGYPAHFFTSFNDMIRCAS